MTCRIRLEPAYFPDHCVRGKPFTMSLSAFDVIGPGMIGPSSSHTAGAARLGLLARGLGEATPLAATIELHGSFAATGKGHATDRALVAGLLGIAPDDPRLKTSLDLAQEAGLTVQWRDIDLGEDVHPNTVRIQLEFPAGERHSILGSSVGGGLVEILRVDGFPTSYNGQLETLLLWHVDQAGFLAKVTAVLACVEVNIASIRTTRKNRADQAFTIVETDGDIPADALGVLRRIQFVERLRYNPRLP